MSLLMEALRKAEAAKRQVQEEQALMAAGQHPSAPEPPLLDTPAQEGLTAGLTLEERDVLQRATEDELEDYLNRPHDPEEMAPSPPRQATLTALGNDTAISTDRQAAATLFAAKIGRARTQRSNNTRLVVLTLITLSLVPAWLAARWYLEHQHSSSLGLNPAIANYDLSSRGYLGEDSAPVPQPEASAAIAESMQPAAAATNDINTTEPESAAEATPAVSNEDTSAAATAALPVQPPLPAAPVPQAAPVAIVPVPPARDDSSPTTAGTSASHTLEITRSASSNSVDPQLQQAYSLFRAGDLATAAQHYRAVTNAAPDNRDALLGLAAIALQQQQPAQAQSHYRRLLDLNPQDHLARTGLLQSITSLAPSERENALRSMLSTIADSAPLHFALGNLYAGQQRWSEAQAAYFDALLQARRSAAEPVNPDYAFNLAISLERLGQRQAALEYYREAQNLARTTRGSFDSTLLNQRLATLEQLLP